MTVVLQAHWLTATLLALCAVLLVGLVLAQRQVAKLRDRLMNAWIRLDEVRELLAREREKAVAKNQLSSRKLSDLKQQVDELKELGAALLFLRPAVESLREDLSDFGRLQDDQAA